MRLKRINATDDSATATWHGDDAVPFAAIDPFAGNNGASLAWQTAPDRLIGDVLALHRVPALLAERLLVAAEAARHRPAVARATLGQENAPEASDPLRDLAAALGDCLSFATFSGLWRAGSSWSTPTPSGPGPQRSWWNSQACSALPSGRPAMPKRLPARCAAAGAAS